MPDGLAIVSLVAPAVELLPILALALPVHQPIALPGVRSITVKTVTPRRSYILSTLCALALSHALDTAALILDLVGTPFRSEPHSHTAKFITAVASYGIGGVVVFSLAAILSEWRAKWGDKSLVVLAVLALGFEVPVLVMTIMRQVHSGKLYYNTANFRWL